MLGIGFALLVLGYTSAYVGIQNLKNGGKGPKFFEALGVTGNITGASYASGGDGGTITTDTPNLTGQPPSQNQSPAQVIQV